MPTEENITKAENFGASCVYAGCLLWQRSLYKQYRKFWELIMVIQLKTLWNPFPLNWSQKWEKWKTVWTMRKNFGRDYMARQWSSTLENRILSLFLSYSSHVMIPESLEPIFSELSIISHCFYSWCRTFRCAELSQLQLKSVGAMLWTQYSLQKNCFGEFKIMSNMVLFGLNLPGTHEFSVWRDTAKPLYFQVILCRKFAVEFLVIRE